MPLHDALGQCSRELTDRALTDSETWLALAQDDELALTDIVLDNATADEPEMTDLLSDMSVFDSDSDAMLSFESHVLPVVDDALSSDDKGTSEKKSSGSHCSSYQPDHGRSAQKLMKNKGKAPLRDCQEVSPIPKMLVATQPLIEEHKTAMSKKKHRAMPQQSGSYSSWDLHKRRQATYRILFEKPSRAPPRPVYQPHTPQPVIVATRASGAPAVTVPVAPRTSSPVYKKRRKAAAKQTPRPKPNLSPTGTWSKPRDRVRVRTPTVKEELIEDQAASPTTDAAQEAMLALSLEPFPSVEEFLGDPGNPDLLSSTDPIDVRVIPAENSTQEQETPSSVVVTPDPTTTTPDTASPTSTKTLWQELSSIDLDDSLILADTDSSSLDLLKDIDLNPADDDTESPPDATMLDALLKTSLQS